MSKPDENSTLHQLAELRRQNAKLKAVVEKMESEHKYSLLFEKSAFPTVLSKWPEGIIVEVNEAFEQEFGLKRKEVIGKTTSELVITPNEEDKKRILEILSKTDLVHHQEMVLSSKSGEKQYYEINIDKVTFNGEEYLINTIQNISEYKRTKDKLKDSYELLRIAGEKAKLGGWNIILEEKRVYWSDEVAAIHEMPAGYTPHIKDAINFCVPEWRDKITEVFTRCVHEGLAFDVEIEIITSTGKRVWVQIIGEAIKDHNGKIYKIQGAFQDITLKKQAEKEIKDSEARYKAIFESTGTATLIVGRDNTTLMANAECLNAIGYYPSELIDRKWTEFVAPEYIEEMLRNHELRRKNPELAVSKYEVKLLNKKGEKRDVVLNVNMIPETDQSVVSMLDITERKKFIDDLKEAKEKAEENEKKFSIAFQCSPGMSMITTVDTGEILEVNDAFELISGYSKAEIIEDSTININLWMNKGDRVKFIDKLVQEGKVLDFESTFRKNSGEAIIGLISGQMIQVYNQNCLLSVIHDITDIKNAETELIKAKEKVEASEEKFRNLYESLSISYLILKDGVFIECNEATLPIYGIDSKDEIIGKSPADYSPEFQPNHLKSSEEAERHIQTAIEKGFHTFEWTTMRKNKEEFFFEVSLKRFYHKNELFLQCLVADISERKRIENELIAAKDRAEESDRLKSAFLANMSHEIRTPMNGILGFTNLILEPDLSDDTKEKYIGIINKSGERMLNTVNDIIEISKIETGLVELRSEIVDFNNRIEELIQFFTPEADAKGLKIIIEKLLPEEKSKLFTDQNKLDSILTNLIKNAIKYTPDGTISIGCHIKESYIEFYINDTGIGIPKHRQKAIFNRFEQADIEDKMALEGSGLGLAIAKSYVEMLGGKIWVESDEGKGSTFYFTLPVTNNTLEKTINEEKIISENKNAKIKKIKIVIAEDDEISRKYLSLLLDDFCSEILQGETGSKIVELCRSNPDIDLILMDVLMPGMNGYEATRQIRDFNRDVIIIAQTAFALAGDKEKAIDAGCNDYISKPIDRTKLENLLIKYFG